MIFIKIYFLLNLLTIFYFLNLKDIKNDFKQMKIKIFLNLYLILIILMMSFGIFVFKKSKEGN